MSRFTAVSFALFAVACNPPPSPAPMPPDASDAALPPIIDGGYLHSYRCPVGDGGSSWSCQDGLTTAVGTCARFGCVPAAP